MGAGAGVSRRSLPRGQASRSTSSNRMFERIDRKTTEKSSKQAESMCRRQRLQTSKGHQEHYLTAGEFSTTCDRYSVDSVEPAQLQIELRVCTFCHGAFRCTAFSASLPVANVPPYERRTFESAGPANSFAPYVTKLHIFPVNCNNKKKTTTHNSGSLSYCIACWLNFHTVDWSGRSFELHRGPEWRRVFLLLSWVESGFMLVHLQPVNLHTVELESTVCSHVWGQFNRPARKMSSCRTLRHLRASDKLFTTTSGNITLSFETLQAPKKHKS